MVLMMTVSVQELKERAMKVIIESDFRAHQESTLDRWVATFLHVNHAEHGLEHLHACRIMKLVLATIAQGDFKIKTSESEDFHAPFPELTITDYISHASRIIFDLTELSDEHREILKAIISTKLLTPRTSTHCLEVNEQGFLRELKSKRHGAIEFGKNFLHWLGDWTGANSMVEGIFLQGPALTDFGINIQMGGFGQSNLSGGQSDFGLDGHIFVYKDSGFDALLIGLEQSAPMLHSRAELPSRDDNTVGLSGTHSGFL